MRSIKHNNHKFIRRSVSRWGHKFGYARVKYVNSRTPIQIYCLTHDIYFEQTPKAHFAAKHECCPLCYKKIAGVHQNKWRNDLSKDKTGLNKRSVNVEVLLNEVFSLT